jgi:hypothetical protein
MTDVMPELFIKKLPILLINTHFISILEKRHKSSGKRAADWKSSYFNRLH